MNCPICKTALIVGGKERLETLDEHVCCCQEISLKDSYICTNENCSAFNVLMWAKDGEQYSKDHQIKHSFVDNNSAPFGSFHRKCNVEFYKHDEDKTVLKFKFKGKKYKLERYYSYVSDEDGNILKRKGHFRLWINSILYMSGIRMLIFSIKQFHRELKIYKDYKVIEFHDWEKKDWWRVVAHKYKMIYFKLFVKGV